MRQEAAHTENAPVHTGRVDVLTRDVEGQEQETEEKSPGSYSQPTTSASVDSSKTE